jgi:hypothetical protein
VGNRVEFGRDISEQFPKRRAQINTQHLSGQSHPSMSLKIFRGEFVAFFAGQVPVEAHKNIIDSFQKLIVSPKRFICAHGEQLSQAKAKVAGHGVSFYFGVLTARICF